jgi:hypothetical protein
MVEPWGDPIVQRNELFGMFLQTRSEEDADAQQLMPKRIKSTPSTNLEPHSVLSAFDDSSMSTYEDEEDEEDDSEDPPLPWVPYFALPENITLERKFTILFNAYVRHTLHQCVYSNMGASSEIDTQNDSMSTIKSKRDVMTCGFKADMFEILLKTHADYLYNKYLQKLLEKNDPTGTSPLIIFYKSMRMWREMHMRNVKKPAKATFMSTMCNSWNGEIYDRENPVLSKTSIRRMIILHPLNTDIDPMAQDDVDMSPEEAFGARLLRSMEGKIPEQVPNPYGIIVTDRGSLAFQLLHNIFHYGEYMRRIVMDHLNPDLLFENITSKQVLQLVAGEKYSVIDASQWTPNVKDCAFVARVAYFRHVLFESLKL